MTDQNPVSGPEEAGAPAPPPEGPVEGSPGDALAQAQATALKIEEECFGTEKFGPETVRAFASRSDAFVLLAIDGDDTVGSAMCIISEEASGGKIASIAVVRRDRGKGIGALLLEACEREFGNRDLRRCTLEVETENEPAISLYLSRGYEATGIIKGFYSNGRDAYCMEKRIGARSSVLIRPS